MELKRISPHMRMLGERVHLLRRRLRLSQLELAKRAGMSPTTSKRHEQAKNVHDSRLSISLPSEVLNTSPNALLGVEPLRGGSRIPNKTVVFGRRGGIAWGCTDHHGSVSLASRPVTASYRSIPIPQFRERTYAMPEDYRVTIRLSPELYTQLAATRQPMAALVRHALETYLETTLQRQPDTEETLCWNTGTCWQPWQPRSPRSRRRLPV